ncbi:MAG: hypothetical protein NZ925_05705, partial [Sulfolobales archaeon]|nr:hypothetical protein [Sulfolobales archaeon]
MNVLDEEVFAVILAVSVIGSVLAASVALRPEPVEPFTSLGLLNSECKIGEYPREVYAGGEVELCVLVYNYVGYPVLAQVRYKIADRESIPTNTTPSRASALMNVTAVVPHRGELLRKIRVPIPKEVKPADR